MKEPHKLTPKYTPCSWSIDLAALDDTPESRALEQEVVEQLAAAMHGKLVRAVANVPSGRRRPHVMDIIGEEYSDSLTADQIAFEALMMPRVAPIDAPIQN